MTTLLHVTAPHVTPRVRKGLPTGGEWTAQGHSDPGLVTVDETPADQTVVEGAYEPEPAAEVDTGPEFEWTRIESLMGNDFHLDPNRTASIPVMKIDDDIAQMTRKVMTYVAKTQSVDGLSDAEVAAMVGMTVDPDNCEMSDKMRSMCDVPEGERIVVAVGKGGRPVYLSTSSSFKKIGSYRVRATGQVYDIANIAPQIVAARYQAKFTEEHPEFDAKAVDRLFRLLADKRYSGKGYKYMWDESYLPADGVQVLAMSMALSEVTAHPDMTVQEFSRLISRMPADEVRAQLDKCEVGTANAYDSRVGTFIDVPAYTATLGGWKVRVGKELTDAHLTGETSHAKAAALNRAYRTFLEDELDLEYDYQRSRTYIRDANASHSATVFEEKKNVPQSHIDAAEQGFFRSSGDFKHVELDSDTDLDRVGQLEREYAQLRKHLPQTTSAPTLRFRKTGRHKALGVYHPHAQNLAVDPRSPSSFVHELIHHVDHTAGEKNISSGEEFRPLLRAIQRNLAKSTSPAVQQRLAYYQTPTECLSRVGEAYYYWQQPGTSLNGDAAKYEDNGAFKALEPLRDQIIPFWEKMLTDLGAEPFQAVAGHTHAA